MGKLGRLWPLWAALLLAALMIAAGWPGIAQYDSVEQFGQILSGRYDDWHPPIMARLWSLFHLMGGGAGPMMALQILLFWLGLGLLAAALAKKGARRAAFPVLAIGALPWFAVWQWSVLKDVQMVAAMLAATGVIGWWRLRGVRVPWIGWVLAGLLLAYASLVRANALFATIPLIVMVLPRGRWFVRLGLVVAGLLAVLALTPLINADLLGATPSGVQTTEPLFDLAAIAVRTGDSDATGIAPAEIEVLRREHCVKPYFWDPLGGGACADAVDDLGSRPVGEMYAMLAGAAFRHPIAYAGHRLAHLDRTERWLVGRGLIDSWPPAESQPNRFGLGDPGRAASWFIDATRPLADTPLGWPIVWLVVALPGLIEALRRPPASARDLALALLVSAISLEASFAAISIAADLRYHLWPMIAAAVGAVLLWSEARPSRRLLLAGGGLLALVITAGILARAILPPAPSSYTAMLAS
ncbi:MAG: hypothetical protein ACTHJR_17610 [Sphingomonas sp.]|uniref:hypothetical protein n=1 Tax=Sphingomonas sp. TaxID=28214 RepID=UPI003F7F41AE